MAVPSSWSFDYVVQDNRGFRSNVRFVGFNPDISADGNLISDLWTAVAAVGTALAATTNAKVVSTGFSFQADIAQEPSSETGTYQLVMQKARLNFGDGNGLREHPSIPAPKDALFLTSADNNLIVVNPAASILTSLQSALAGIPTASGGTYGSQFFGGQLTASKPRIRRVLQGA